MTSKQGDVISTGPACDRFARQASEQSKRSKGRSMALVRDMAATYRMAVIYRSVAYHPVAKAASERALMAASISGDRVKVRVDTGDLGAIHFHTREGPLTIERFRAAVAAAIEAHDSGSAPPIDTETLNARIRR